MSTQLDQEFEAVKKEINSKLREAAWLIADANNLASDHGKSMISDSDPETGDILFQGIGDLINAMDNCGWRTSSLAC